MIHSPKQSEAFYKLIASLTTVQFIDSSYGNDCCDSIMNEEMGLQIFFPNVTDVYKDMQSEDFINFAISLNDTIDRSFTILEVISFVNALDRVLKCDGEEVTMLDFVIANIDSFDVAIVPVLALGIEDYITLGGGAFATSEIERIK